MTDSLDEILKYEAYIVILNFNIVIIDCNAQLSLP